MNMKKLIATNVALAVGVAGTLQLAASGAPAETVDWLLDSSPYVATVREDGGAWVLENGLVRRVVTTKPGTATTSFKCLTTEEEFVRAVSPEARVRLDGVEYAVGGLAQGDGKDLPVQNYLLTPWIAELKPLPGAYAFKGAEVGEIEERLAWKPRREWLSRDVAWPPKGRHLVMHYEMDGAGARPLPSVDVHYEIYDGAPLVSKWLVLSNGTDRAVHVDSFTADEIRLAEPSGMQDFEWQPVPFNMYAESNYGYGGAVSWRGNGSAAIHYGKDKSYRTQEEHRCEGVNTLRCYPSDSPGAVLEPGGTFESFRVWELLFDTTERERRGLAMRRMYRILAPWTCENPLMFHRTSSQPDDVRAAIEQCRQTGFELIIMSFQSKFNMESKDPAYRALYKGLADEARAAGIALGGYSLTGSRSAGVKADNVQNPKPIWGKSPCLCSRWGRDYLDTIASFMDEAGFGVFENDGPFPGDWCAATNHPYHAGREDSVWKQWRAQSDLFRFCRARGIYVNQPDMYYLEGGSKCGGGYRETNWSLPREYQVLIERQNVYDNNWTRNTTMHWMFVPLSQYHGGGSAATVEPLAQHLEHYSSRFANLLGAGIQAIWRGPRLYDTPETLAMVRKWVKFYKDNRRVLDGDMIHMRRPDGRDWDGWVMVDPTAGDGVRAIASLFNPLDRPIRRRIALPLYYAGLSGSAEIAIGDGADYKAVALDGYCRAVIEVDIPANGNLHVYAKPNRQWGVAK